jgi:hypothetical protein
MRRSALIVLAALAGCAHGGTHEKMLGYTDHNLFVLEHHDPAHGGRIVGTVCGVDVQLDARLRNDGVRLVGNASDRHGNAEGMHRAAMGAWDPSSPTWLPMTLEVRDRAADAERVITGTVGESEFTAGATTPQHGVDLALSRERVRGRVGSRTFDLLVRGDDYVGKMRIWNHEMPFVVRGASSMWAMPAAAQAAVLPLALTCSEPNRIIQLVDLRQLDGPPPMPPRWWTPASPPSPGASPVAAEPSRNAANSPARRDGVERARFAQSFDTFSRR